MRSAAVIFECERIVLICNSDANEDAWVWKTDDGVELFFDRNETVRFRVEAEEWSDMAPQQKPGAAEDPDEFENKSPYAITASMQQSGLGPLLWWGEVEAEE